MKLKKRWELAELSELTRIGRLFLVLCIGTILFMVIHSVYILLKNDLPINYHFITVMVISLAITVLTLYLICIFIWLLGLIIFWILQSYYGWSDISNLLITSYKLIFGDYRRKIKRKKSENSDFRK